MSSTSSSTNIQTSLARDDCILRFRDVHVNLTQLLLQLTLKLFFPMRARLRRFACFRRFRQLRVHRLVFALEFVDRAKQARELIICVARR